MAPAFGLGFGLPFNAAVLGGGPIVPPAGFDALGNSLIANGNGVGRSGSTYSVTRGCANNFCGPFVTAIDNKLLTRNGWNFGLGASTSINAHYRLSSTSTAATGNPAQALTGNASDAGYDTGSDGAYSPLTSPSNVVLIQPERNDYAYTGYYTSPLVTMVQVAADVDALIAAGKVRIYVQSATPEGRTCRQHQALTIVGNTATFNLPAGSTDFMAGDDFGVAGLIGDDPTIGANKGVRAFTKVTGTPAQFEYAVSVAGVAVTYTFNAATPPANAKATYDYLSLSTTPLNNAILYEWQKSSAADFTSSTSGSFVDYGVPGLLHGRPQLTFVDAWAAILKPGTSGASALNAPGTKGNASGAQDTIHPTQYGCHLVTTVQKAAFDADYPGLTSLAQAPASNNMRVATANGVLTSFQGGVSTTLNLSTSIKATIASTHLLAFLVANSTSNIMGLLSVDPATGAVSGTYNSGSVTGTVNFATGAYTLTFPVAPAVNTRIYALTDLTNLLINGMMDTSFGTLGALPTNVTGTLLPTEWTMTVDAGTATALAAGSQCSCTTSVAADGRYKVALEGHSGTGASITLQQTVFVPTLRTSPTDLLRGYGRTTILPGPTSGRLFGPYATPVKFQVSSSAGVDRGGSSGAPYTILANSALNGANTLPMDERQLGLNGVAGEMTWAHLTDSISLSGLTITQMLLTFQLNYLAGPVSCAWLLGEAHVRPGWSS